MKTQAAILVKTGEPLVIDDIEIPALKEGQVLIKVKASGFCRSQLNEIEGKKGPDPWLPHTLGHEASGEVQDRGTGVKKLKPGDSVVMTWIQCEGCRAKPIYYFRGNEKINSGPVTTFSQYAVVAENRLVKVDASMPKDLAALFGCALPTGMGIVLNSFKAKPEHDLVILGVGGIGMSAVIGGRVAGCRKIIAVDVCDWKLDLAKKLGATDTLLMGASPDNLPDKVLEITKSKGASLVIESAGQIQTMEMSLELLSTAGTAVIAGNVSHGNKFKVDPYQLIQGKKIIGTWGGETQPDLDIPIFWERIKSLGISLESLITKRFDLQNINDAIRDFKKGLLCRALIEMN